MERDTLEKAMEQISDRHIAEAAQTKKRRFPLWIHTVAAVLALVILAGVLARPFLASDSQTPSVPNGPGYSPYLLAAPVYPQMAAYPTEEDMPLSDFNAWMESRQAQYDQPTGYADSASDCLITSTQLLLSAKDGRNTVCSPVNVYMTLAMLAEVTEGESRQQILDALGADSIEALRTQAGHVWNAHYCDDGATTLTLANSLWLDQSLDYNDATVQTLADSYYASVLQGQLGTEEMNQALRSWINDQTGGLLEQQTEALELGTETLLALASTVYYRCKWDSGSRFLAEYNTQGVFHSPQADRTVTFMNQTLSYGPYYWGEHYSAAYLYLEDGSRMWLILPDRDSSPTALLEAGIIEQVLNGPQESKQIKVNLSLPKFDISSDLRLKDTMQAMGISDVFGTNANFSAILSLDTPQAGLSTASHAARVAIDEEGIIAAAYTVLADAGASPPPEEEVDLVLDRPFLFLVESRDGLPLFAGIVNEP